MIIVSGVEADGVLWRCCDAQPFHALVHAQELQISTMCPVQLLQGIKKKKKS